MPGFTDQMGRVTEIPQNPRRIVSLVPSQTELLFSLGLGERVSGITKFCVHPETWRSEKTIIGGTKNFHSGRINRLQPDLIIGNKEENYKEGIEALEKDYPVWMSDIFNLESALEMIRLVGMITGTGEKAAEVALKTEESFSQLVSLPEVRGLYFIWRKPYMAAGGNTFIDDMLKRFGIKNLLASQARYPVVTEEQIRQLNPEVVVLSSEPYPFAEKHIREIKNLCPEAEVVLADGEMFSWYGSRLLYAVPYFKSLQEDLRLRLKL